MWRRSRRGLPLAHETRLPDLEHMSRAGGVGPLYSPESRPSTSYFPFEVARLRLDTLATCAHLSTDERLTSRSRAT